MANVYEMPYMSDSENKPELNKKSATDAKQTGVHLTTIIWIIVIYTIGTIVIAIGTGIVVYFITTGDKECKLVLPDDVSLNRACTQMQDTTEATTKPSQYDNGTELGRTITQCPDGWLPYIGSCYLFSSVKVDFTVAEVNCCKYDRAPAERVVTASFRLVMEESNSADNMVAYYLVHIETAAENTFLKSFANDLKDADHWIGITDQMIEGVWRWYNTDNLATFTDWYPGQPDAGRAGPGIWRCY